MRARKRAEESNTWVEAWVYALINVTDHHRFAICMTSAHYVLCVEPLPDFWRKFLKFGDVVENLFGGPIKII
jgi:hypothetical protein